MERLVHQFIDVAGSLASTDSLDDWASLLENKNVLKFRTEVVRLSIPVPLTKYFNHTAQLATLVCRLGGAIPLV
jgi:hypothetical protein